ncbi:hypothetical protein [Nostoc cycadae]|uniref:GntR family transcriptional regulator n=1 Tax=Nostoc cycadae WK-1 TaxID=1861711 RepID=A0A2H6LCI0_9NOSO|nr:hypothetical protein [Nostoc cycadae]GBE90846.1 GntR family transcriptional regulator [Nostoc cycadae WK-1]
MDNKDQAPAKVNETSDHIKLTDISGNLWLAIAHLEEYKSELPQCIEKHRITRTIAQIRKALVFYGYTRHSNVDLNNDNTKAD